MTHSKADTTSLTGASHKLCETIQDHGEMTPQWDEAWTEMKASE